MKAVFFKSTIPIEIYEENEDGRIEPKTIMRSMEQGEVVDISYIDDGMMQFSNGTIWWVPDKKLFNIVQQGGPVEKCCGG